MKRTWRMAILVSMAINMLAIALLPARATPTPTPTSTPAFGYYASNFNTGGDLTTPFVTTLGVTYTVTLDGYVCHNPSNAAQGHDALYSTDDINSWPNHFIPSFDGVHNYGVLLDGQNLPDQDYSPAHHYVFLIAGTGAPFVFKAANNSPYSPCGGQFDISILVPTPTPTPTPTAMPSPTPTVPPPPPALGTYAPCPLLGVANSLFEAANQWSLNGGASVDSAGGLLLPHGASASLNLVLSKSRKYSMQSNFVDPAYGTSNTGEAFSIQLGTHSTVFHAPILDNSQQTIEYDTWAANYSPDNGSSDPGGYTLTLAALAYPGTATLKINYLCVTDTTPGASGGGGSSGGGGNNTIGDCKTCAVPSDSIDLGGWLNWLACNLVNLWLCIIYPIFMGVWQIITDIAHNAVLFFVWLGTTVGLSIDWVNGNLTILGNYVGGFFNNIIGAFTTLISTGLLMWSILSSVASTIVTSILNAIGLVIIIVQSLLAGLTDSSTQIPTWAPNCSDTHTFAYGLCLTSYITDNTVFDGPMYYTIPILMGAIVLFTFRWSIAQIRGALTK